MKEKSLFSRERGLLWLLYAGLLIVCCVLSRPLFLSGDIAGCVVNFGMFAIIALVFGFSSMRFRSAGALVRDLKNATRKINQDSAQNDGLLFEKYRRKTDLFTNPELRDSWSSYLQEISHLERSGNRSTTCDLEDYINEDSVDNVIHKRMLELIPGVMTGLGILGTFVGLTLGLYKFSLDTEQIEQSISPLINGIRTAFYTSVFGMVFSLCYSFLYRRILSTSYAAVDSFLLAYREKVLPDPYNESVNSLLGYEQERTNQLRDLAEHLSDDLADKLSAAVKPDLQNIQSSIVTLQGAINKGQMDQLQAIVNNFLSSMNESLSSSFTEFGNVLHETSSLQKQNNEQNEQILKRIEDMSEQTIQINQLSQKTITDVSGFVTRMDAISEKLDGNYRDLDALAKSNANTLTQQQQYVADIQQYMLTLRDGLHSINLEFASQAASLRDMSEKLGESTAQQAEAIADSTRNIEASLAGASREQQTALSAITASLDNATEKQMAALSGMAASLDKAIEKEMSAIEDSARKTNEAIKAASELQTQSFDDTLEKVRKALREDLEAAAERLEHAAGGIDDEMVNSLTRTFNVFDTQLSDIEKHLSGTIQQIDATTGRVPKVVASAYEGMQKSFDDLANNMDDLASSIREVDRKSREAQAQIQKAADETTKAAKKLEPEQKNSNTEAKN